MEKILNSPPEIRDANADTTEVHEQTPSKDLSQTEKITAMLDSFYSSHQSLIQEIFDHFTEIQNSSDFDKEIPRELHQQVENYVLRLNQDAVKLNAKPLIKIAQKLFTLLVQHPLVDIETELKSIGEFILQSIEQAKEQGNADSIVVPEHIKTALGTIEFKMSGKAPEFSEQNSDPEITQASANPNSQTTTISQEIAHAKTFVKIDIDKLDSLVEMIGELMIRSSILVKKCRELSPTDGSTMRISDQVEVISRELQTIGMAMRLSPISDLFQKLSRFVWDTSNKFNRDIKLVVTGEDTELERNMLEGLADPLMQMIRNAFDHGLEHPKVRRAHGKDPSGTIEISCFQEDESIFIEIKDDGRGMDPIKLLEKAKEKGFVAEGNELNEDDIFQLIFISGFSTADKATDISSRGFGMDVVRTNVERMGGSIKVKSELGEGTTFSIKLQAPK